MHILLVYDISEDKVQKIMKICREYLNHIQNSVFEGDITSANYKKLCGRIKQIINENVDSVLIYELWNPKKTVIGIEKRETSNII